MRGGSTSVRSSSLFAVLVLSPDTPHSGLISNNRGGCASLQLVGNFTDYLPLTKNGLTSIGFPSVFPLSFQFLPTTPLHSCFDTRNEALAFNVIITALLFLVLRPKPIVCYWCLVCIGFWHVTLFSQPQASPPPLDTAFQRYPNLANY